ncbi:Peptidyl-prolyl cis-trans isomerase [Hibiscus syriacus]|uniref:Peptidyl-prolyl cis-trans isomerase n=1 Tax=Hibiscus syriacus TaxID=106335 RepID=A0A6A3CJN5_HIBSY|nr:Peptidyl-prolyl cis-trans isomerase [Hibiscus syriacus]
MSNSSSPSPDQGLQSNASPSPPPEVLWSLPAPPPSRSTLAETAAVTPNPRRLPPPCWSYDETVALIDAYRDKCPDDENGEDEEDGQEQEFYDDVYKNGTLNTRSVQKLYRNGVGKNGGSVSGSGGGEGNSGGFRIKIPTGVSIAQPGPRYYGKIDQKYAANPNPNPSLNTNSHTSKVNFGGSGSRSAYGTRILRGFDDMPEKMAVSGKREREKDAVTEMVSAIKVLGDGFVRMGQMKMEMAREIETMQMEMKRTEVILESQQRIVEAFAKAVSERKKEPKRMASPQS